MTRVRMEIEETRLGWIDMETEPDVEAEGLLRARAREAVEEGLLVPQWSDDSTIHTCRCYDADAECRRMVGSETPYCSVHDEPFEEGLDCCWRRADDLAAENDPQERLW